MKRYSLAVAAAAVAAKPQARKAQTESVAEKETDGGLF